MPSTTNDDQAPTTNKPTLRLVVPPSTAPKVPLEEQLCRRHGVPVAWHTCDDELVYKPLVLVRSSRKPSA